MSESEKNADSAIVREYDECMFLNKMGLSIVGLWPLEHNASERRIFARRIHLCAMYFFIFSVLIPQWLDMYSLWGNIDANAETFMPSVFIFAVMIKISNFLMSKDTFEDVLETMRSNWICTMKMPNSKENRDVLYHLATKARDHSTKYGVIVCMTASLYAVMPFLNNQGAANVRDRSYPFFGRYYFDRSSDFIYGLCYMGQIIAGSIAAIANIATDTIFMVCVYHFCAQLRILQNDLMCLCAEPGNSVRTQLTYLIRRHQAEIRNAQALQSIFSGTSLQQLLVSCLIICINGFKLIVSLSNRDIDLIVYVVCLPVSFFQILFYCGPGNELILQSQSLDEAIYQSSWVNLDRVTIRTLIIMIQRSQKPLAITAGKIYVLSLQNFMRICKTSLSALSVLQAMYSKDK